MSERPIISKYRHLYFPMCILFRMSVAAKEKNEIMRRRSKEISYPHLNNCNGDVKGKWYGEYSVTNKITGEKIRQRIYEGFDQFKTYKDSSVFSIIFVTFV